MKKPVVITVRVHGHIVKTVKESRGMTWFEIRDELEDAARNAIEQRLYGLGILRIPAAELLNACYD
jgi:hypothetical protein